jgi:hypothetical protein
MAAIPLPRRLYAAAMNAGRSAVEIALMDH